MEKPIPKENKNTPAKSQPKGRILPIVVNSQMARNHIEQMNAKVAEIKTMYPRLFTPPQPMIPIPPPTEVK